MTDHHTIHLTVWYSIIIRPRSASTMIDHRICLTILKSIIIDLIGLWLIDFSTVKLFGSQEWNFFWTPCIIELRCWCDDWSSYRHFEFKMKYDDWSSNQCGVWSMMIDFPPCFPCKCHNWKYAKPSTGLGHASWRHKGIEKKNNCDFNNNLYISYEIPVGPIKSVLRRRHTRPFSGFCQSRDGLRLSWPEATFPKK